MTENFIPMSTIIAAGATIALLVIPAIAGFLFVKGRVASWGNVLISGLLAGALFNIVLPNAVSIAISYIPGVSDFFAANLQIQSIVSLFMKYVFEILSVILGYWILQRNGKRNNLVIGLGEIIAFGVGIFVVDIFMSSLFSYLTEFITNATYINSMGFDAAVTYYVESSTGYSEADIRTALLNLAEQRGIDFIAAGLVMIFNGLVDISLCIIFYGIKKNILDKKFFGLLFGELFIFEIPNIISIFIEMPEVVYLISCFVVLAGVVFATYWVIKTYFAAEWDAFYHKKNGPRPPQKKETQKMPKIVMPD